MSDLEEWRPPYGQIFGQDMCQTGLGRCFEEFGGGALSEGGRMCLILADFI